MQALRRAQQITGFACGAQVSRGGRKGFRPGCTHRQRAVNRGFGGSRIKPLGQRQRLDQPLTRGIGIGSAQQVQPPRPAQQSGGIGNQCALAERD